jgi:tetratricopeptide (TPR) repeat protein
MPGSTGSNCIATHGEAAFLDPCNQLKIDDMKRDRHILQKYLDNELSESELNRFKQELSVSPDLMVDLDLYREVDEAISDTEVLDFRAQLNGLREESKRSESGRRVFRFNRPWHYAASAALALLVAIGLATVLGRPLSNSDLFVKYMKPYELVLTNRSMESSVIMALMNNAEVAYMQGDFEKAVFWFGEVLVKDPAKVEADFSIGVSNMGLQKYVDASESFDRVINQDDNLFIQKAEWFQAGCLLAMDETDRARRQLIKIANEENHFYHNDAEKILKRMKR